MADQICYAVLCVFSYIAAGLEHRKQQQTTTHNNQSDQATSSIQTHQPHQRSSQQLANKVSTMCQAFSNSPPRK